MTTFEQNSTPKSGLECVEELNFENAIPRDENRVENDIPASDAIPEDAGESEMEQEELSSESDSLPIQIVAQNSFQNLTFKRTKRKSDEYLAKKEIAKCFFQIFFRVNPKSSVLKDLVYLLYQKKVATGNQLARHILYRVMWKSIESISVVQSNYKEYIKGIELVTSLSQQDSLERSQEIQTFGKVENLFNYTEAGLLNELEANKLKEKEETSNTLIEQVEMLENLTKELLQEIKALKNDLKKEYKKRRKS